MNKLKVLNLPAIRRFPTYLHILKRLDPSKYEYVSTAELIDRLDFEAVLIRKDLAGLGLKGVPRRGYPLEGLISAIEEFLGWNKDDEAFLIGTGSLGQALLGYEQFSDRGLKIVAAFDSDVSKCGSTIAGKSVFHIARMQNLAARMGIKIALLCVPWQDAQEAAELLVKAGITAIWNFTAQELELPDDVICHHENLMSSLAVFSVKMKSHFKEHK
jgi:redox-sensing transcriptional repressor